MITILLADDHQVVRQGLRALLRAEPDFAIVGETGDGLEAVQLAERLKPDVLIVDLKMPGLGGLEVVHRVSQRSPRTRAIVLSMYASEAYVYEARRTGALGYVPKESSAAELAQAVREVAAGRRYFSPSLPQQALEAYAQRARSWGFDPYSALTQREREVLPLLAQGLTSAEVAQRLSISPRTAEAHRARVMHKLGLRSQTELALYAVRRGILPLDE
jgi:DNA-binding NarL/FixJ family response regulator